MAQQTIDIGTVANDGTGDPIRDAFDKCNDNFTELYTGLTGLLDFKGSTDCSANPNYPAASKGDYYLVSVAGKIGGASGISVEVGDSYFALADNAGGTQAGVGTSWTVVQGNIAFTPVNKAGDTMTGDLVVPDEAYDATNWNASLEVPTKNAVRDKIEDILDGVTFTGDIVVPDEAYDATNWNGSLEVPTKNAVRDKIESLGTGITELDDIPDVNAPSPSDGDVLTWDSTPGEWVALPSSGGISTIVIGFEIDGGGSTITTGFKGYSALVPAAHTITKVTALSVDTAGPATSCSITVDVWNDVIGSYPPTSGDKISASAPVTLSTSTNSQDSTLSGWDTATPADSVYGFSVATVTGAKKVLILIEATV